MPPYLYTLCLTNPGRVVQTDLATLQVVRTINISGNRAHIPALSEDKQYLYVGTLSSPLRIVKIKIPEMTEELYVDVPDVPRTLFEFSGRLYAGAGNGTIYEYDSASLAWLRTLNVGPTADVTGIIQYNGYLYANTGRQSGASGEDFNLFRIDPNTFSVIDSVLIPVAQGVDVGSRVSLEAGGLLYVLIAGYPTATRIVTVDPNSMTVLRYDDFPDSTGPDRLVYDGQYIYWNQDVRPSKISRLNPSTYQHTVIVLPTNNNRAADVDLYGRTIFATNYWTPGVVGAVNLDTFTYLGAINLGAGNDTPIQSIVAEEEAPPPPLLFSITPFPDSGYAPLSVQFSKVSSGPWVDPSTYYWDFGDGTISTSDSPTKTYDTPGEYTVYCTRTDSLGQQRTANAIVTVLEPPVIASISGEIRDASTQQLIPEDVVLLMDLQLNIIDLVTTVDGTFRFYNVNPGDYLLFVNSLDYLEAQEPVTVVAGQTTQVVIYLTPIAPPPPTGVLSLDTGPVKGGVFVNGGPWGVAPQTRTVDVGIYVVTFGQVDGYDAPQSETVEVLQDQVRTVTGIYTEIPPPPPPEKVSIAVPLTVGSVSVAVPILVGWLIAERL